MGAWGKVALTVVVGALAAPTVACADDTVSIAPIPGPHFKIHGTQPEYLRTDSAQPSFLVAENGSDGFLSCAVDGAKSPSCGTPVGGCPVTACFIYQPTLSGPGNGSNHVVSAAYTDADGDNLISVGTPEVDFTYDTTPPNTFIGADPEDAYDTFRPSITAGANDDAAIGNQVGDPAIDSLQCSFVKAGRPALWRSCPYGKNGDGVTFSAGAVPHRHIDYTFSARAFDDFGRVDPTPATFNFDPIPCTVKVGRTTARSLIKSPYVTASIACSYLATPAVGVFPIQTYGHRAQSRNAALDTGAFASKELHLHLKNGHGSARVRLNIGSDYKAYFRRYRTITMLVAVGGDDLDVESAPYFGESVITVRR